jgi:hypothetical protein
MTPIDRLSDDVLVALAADVIVQLERGTGTRPILFMLADARERARTAISMLIEAEPDQTVIIRKLQNEVKLFIDMIDSAKGVIERGKEADRNIKDDDRAAIDEMVMGMSDEERRLYKFEPRGYD